MVDFAFTTSWDDGSIHDLKLSNLLLKYGIRGTFYIPIKSLENNGMISGARIRELSNEFEIGGHTYSHSILTRIPLREAIEEIRKGKESLEDIVGKEVVAFCFPRGKFNGDLVTHVKGAGFLFARTVSNFRVKNMIDIQNNLMHVSLQIYPHGPVASGISALKGDIETILNYFRVLRSSSDWQELARKLFDHAYQSGGNFHLWGHSWEINEHNLWGMLEEFLKYVTSGDRIIYCTNSELWKILTEGGNENRH